VANLANMCAVAKHDVFVLADSDMRVTPGYLQAVVAPFGDPGVGATTCLYRGTPVRGVWSILGGMGINEWFLPSVLVATTFGRLRYCFGATIAVRRAMLDKIGGFASLVQDLADDYLLGQRVSGQGLAVRLAPYIVDNVLHEPSLQALFVHELRWARTIRALKPLGYAFSFLTYPIPLACLSVLVLPSALGVAALGSALVSRVLLHFAVRTAFGISAGMTPWLVPVREILGFSVWCASFLGRSVQWRTKDFVLDPTGRITPKPFGENKRPLVPECQPD
jgi:ceramide glucosyltransferase